MVILAVWSSLAGPDMYHISGTECINEEVPPSCLKKVRDLHAVRPASYFTLYALVIT